MKIPTSICKRLSTSSVAQAYSVVFLTLSCVWVAPIIAQGDNQGEIVRTSTDLEDLIVTVTWQGSVAADWFEVAVFDENDLQIAEQLVWSSPGERMQTTFENVLHDLPESGFQYSVAIRDSAGHDASQRFAFRVVLECPRPEEPCQWRTQDGLETDALATSEPLLTTLDAFAARRSSDLLSDILDEQPGLRGPVFALAAQIDRMDQEIGLGTDCVCAWHHASIRLPTERRCERIGPGQSNDGSGSEGVEGEIGGAIAFAAGQARDEPMSHSATATGLSWQTMELRCWKIHDWVLETPLPVLSSQNTQSQRIRFPVIEACPDLCSGTVESSAIVGYRLSTRVREFSASTNVAAFAAVGGSFDRDDGSHHPQRESVWDAQLQWLPGEFHSEQKGTIQIPSEGVFVDGNIHRMTTTLTAKASVDLLAKDTWSFATAFAYGSSLQVEGHADCAVPPGRKAALSAALNDESRSDDCGEAQIEPWEG